MKQLYLLSGLGADKRVYDFLELKDYHVTHIEWAPPVGNESIEAYAKRITNQIKTPNPILVGVSFGGVMAIEVGKLMGTEKIILISSAKIKSSIPFYFRIVGSLKLNRLIPTTLFKTVNILTFWFFGVHEAKEKELLRAIINETDGPFLSWAIDKIVNWRNEVELQNVVTIHGTHDRLLPNKTSNFKIKDGGHFMIVNRAGEVSKILNQTINLTD